MDYPIQTSVGGNSGGQRIYHRVRCPMCDSLNVKCYRTEWIHDRFSIRYYKCRECKDLTTRAETRFKVSIV